MKSIVIVDDELAVLEVIKTNLELSLGDTFRFESFSNPFRARDFIFNNKVDAVISDINMPNINGMELYQNIRSKGFDKCFIFLSGFISRYYNDLLHIDQCFIFEKPTSFNIIAETIKICIDVQDYIEEKKLELLVKDFENHEDFLNHYVIFEKLIAQKKMRHFTRLKKLKLAA